MSHNFATIKEAHDAGYGVEQYSLSNLQCWLIPNGEAIQTKNIESIKSNNPVMPLKLAKLELILQNKYREKK